MKVTEFLKIKLDVNEDEEFKKSIVRDNIIRTKIFVKIVIGLEVVLSITDISSSLSKVDNRFQFNNYLFMYMLMILINVILLVYFNKLGNLSGKSIEHIKHIEKIILLYIIFMMLWGSIISLLDQKLYGQLMAFMVNVVACSVIYYMDTKKMVIPYLISSFVLFLGLPFFQKSSDILIGHYVNLLVFIVLSWVATRILYMNYYNDFMSKNQLSKEIEEKNKINKKLIEANKMLKELSLIDELTGIPNRRAFNNYIDFALEYTLKESSLISIIMIDIDWFKQYNDNYGHSSGDNVLKAVAKEIHSVARHSVDFAARFGGEEFIYAASNTEKFEIVKIAEKIRTKIEALNITHDYAGNKKILTVSIGTSTVTVNNPNDVQRSIELADQALYMAKENGRNCVESLNI